MKIDPDLTASISRLIYLSKQLQMPITQQMRQNLHALIERVADAGILHAVSIILEREVATEQQSETDLENELSKMLKKVYKPSS